MMIIKISFYIAIVAYFLTGCAAKTKTDPVTTPASASASTVSNAQPAKKTEPKQEGTVCVNGVDSRTIEVVKADVCEVYYTKFSNRNSVGSSHSSMAHCEDIAKRIQSNLESGGFSCTN